MSLTLNGLKQKKKEMKILNKIILLLFVITILNGCAFFVAKETARAISIVAEDSKAKSENKKRMKNIKMKSKTLLIV